jgi:hypothetical protein
MGKSKKGKSEPKPAADGAGKVEKEASAATPVINEKAEAPAAEEAVPPTKEVAPSKQVKEEKGETANEEGASAEGAALVDEAEKVAAEGSKVVGEEKKEEEAQGEGGSSLVQVYTSSVVDKGALVHVLQFG